MCPTERSPGEEPDPVIPHICIGLRDWLKISMELKQRELSAQCEPEGKMKRMALEAGHTLFLHGVNPNMQVSFLLNYQRKKKEIGFQVNRFTFVFMIIIVTIVLQLKCARVRELSL